MPETIECLDAQLLPHPLAGGGVAAGVCARCDWRPGRTRLEFTFALRGDPSRLALPVVTAGGRQDGLWRHTCFEVFLRGAAAEPYVEFNFSPAGAWAAYRFEKRRAGMRPLPIAAEPDLHSHRLEQGLEMRAAVAPEPAAFPWSGPLRLGFAAVIEGRDGSVGYWALRHPPGPPDFHDPESFTLHLDTSN